MATVLVIDDDANLRQIVEQPLKAAGYIVLQAGSGDEGMELLHSRSVDVVLCDLFMPGKEGIETITDISCEFPQIAIIAMSGGHSGSNQLLSIAGMLGGVRTLEKPFDSQTLLKTIEEALG